MRLPFIQLRQDAIVKARTMARLLKCPAYAGIGLAGELFAWALDMAPEDASGTVDWSGDLGKEDPAQLVAAAVGWDGDPEALLAGFVRVGFIEPADRHLRKNARVKGLDCYEATHAKALKDRDRKRVQRNSGGLPRDGAGQTQTQTQTQTQDQPPPPPTAGSVVVGLEECLSAFDDVRQANGLDPEPECTGFADWLDARSREGFTLRDLISGYARFVTDETIRSQSRSVAVFISNCWQTRLVKLPPPPPPPSPLQVDLAARLEPIRAGGHTYAAGDLGALEPIGWIGDVLQLRAKDRHAEAWVRDHYSEHLKSARLELLAQPEAHP